MPKDVPLSKCLVTLYYVPTFELKIMKDFSAVPLLHSYHKF